MLMVNAVSLVGYELNSSNQLKPLMHPSSLMHAHKL